MPTPGFGERSREQTFTDAPSWIISHTFGGESIDVRRLHPREAVAPQPVRAGRVEGDDDDVELPRRRMLAGDQPAGGGVGRWRAADQAHPHGEEDEGREAGPGENEATPRLAHVRRR